MFYTNARSPVKVGVPPVDLDRRLARSRATLAWMAAALLTIISLAARFARVGLDAEEGVRCGPEAAEKGLGEETGEKGGRGRRR